MLADDTRSKHCGASCSRFASATCAVHCCWPTAPRRATRREAGLAIERPPALLKLSTRETAAFCNKLQRLDDEMRRLGDLIADLSLPALGAERRRGMAWTHCRPCRNWAMNLPIVPLIDGDDHAAQRGTDRRRGTDRIGCR
jgi:hypothetical protein